jgi:hypothetical protein
MIAMSLAGSNEMSLALMMAALAKASSLPGRLYVAQNEGDRLRCADARSEPMFQLSCENTGRSSKDGRSVEALCVEGRSVE